MAFDRPNGQSPLAYPLFWTLIVDVYSPVSVSGTGH
jgi:hypothetical protein